jgi:Fe-Mn family superoxide dismutase
MKIFTAILLTIFFNLGFAQQKQAPPKVVEYEPKDFSHLQGMEGFSDDLLKMHFTLYQGYVKNTNLLSKLIRDYAVEGKARDYPYQALKRRFGWEFDGMRLHELYFANLGGKKPLNRSTSLYQLIVRDFGSFENWKEDFIATGMMRGIGWAILYFDPKADRLFNCWINEHDLGHLAGGDLILVMDVWEHAYITEYGLDRAGYIKSFFANINWDEVVSRFHSGIMRR